MSFLSRRVLSGVVALAAAGAVTAGIATAAKSGKSGDRGGAHERGGPRGPNNEPELTGDAKTRAEAAALEAVPGGTVLRSSEEDGAEDTGARYEVHMTDADGAPVEVLLDADFAVISTEARPMRRPGGRDAHRGPGGRGDRHHGTPVTGEDADKAKAAILAELPGATVERIFGSDDAEAGSAAYHALVIREDGTPALVMLDEAFTVLSTSDAPPRGDRGPRPEPLTGEDADKAKAAAEKAVEGGTAKAAFPAPPFADAAYAVMVTRSGGRPVMVLLDKDFAVLRTMTGPRRGPGARGRRFGARPDAKAAKARKAAKAKRRAARRAAAGG